MNFKNLTLIGAALLLSAPVFGSTYYGGFEDAKGGDYDYNDIVFSLSGTSLKLISSNTFFTQPTIDNNGSPFWDNSSSDGSKMNVGYCIYGGGNCNGGKPLDAGAQFLASSTSHTGSANDVTFSVDGKVSTDLLVQVTSASDSLGYYLVNDPNHSVHSLTPTSTSNIYSFSPGGDFGLVGTVNGLTKYYSNTALGMSDSVSHFAFFNTPAPEPGMMGLLGAGLVSVGTFFRRRKNAQK